MSGLASFVLVQQQGILIFAPASAENWLPGLPQVVKVNAFEADGLESGRPGSPVEVAAP